MKPHPDDFKRQVQAFDEFAVADLLFGDGFGHFTKDVLTRLLYMIKYVPSHIPIALSDCSVAKNWVAYLSEVGVLNTSRVIYRGFGVMWAGKYVWTAGELARGVNTGNEWSSNHNGCAWRNGLPGRLIREMVYKDKQPPRLNRIIVLDRLDRPTDPPGRLVRVLSNQVAVNDALQKAFPDFEFMWHSGHHHTMHESVAMFNQSALLIGVHGAGMALMGWMPPTSAVIEIGYTGEDGFPFFDGDYPAYAMGLGLDYSVSYGHGSHMSVLKANVSDIVYLARQALTRIGALK